MSKYIIDESTLTGIADAIRTKKGTSEAVAVTDFASEVEAIETAEEWDGTFTVTGEPTTDGGSGGTGSNTFKFQIDGKEYTAEGGMSWEQWVNSEYNTYGYYVGGITIQVAQYGNNYRVNNFFNNTNYVTYIYSGISATHYRLEYMGSQSGGSGN